MTNLSWYASPSVAGSGGGGSGGGPVALTDLTDVSLNALASGDVFQYNGIDWANNPALASWYRVPATNALVANPTGYLHGAVYGLYAIDGQQHNDYLNYTAAADNSMCFGLNVINESGADYSFNAGHLNSINLPYSAAFGQNITVYGDPGSKDSCYGFGNNIQFSDSKKSLAIGNAIEIFNADYSFAYGDSHTLTQPYTRAGGVGCYASVWAMDAYCNDNFCFSDKGSGTPNFRGDMQRSTLMYKGFIQDSGGTSYYPLTLGNSVGSPQFFSFREHRAYAIEIDIIGTRRKIYGGAGNGNAIVYKARGGAVCQTAGLSYPTFYTELGTNDDGAADAGADITFNVDFTNGNLYISINQNNLWNLPGAVDDEESIGYIWNAKIELLESPAFDYVDLGSP